MIDQVRLDAHLANGEVEYIMCAANYVNDGIDHNYKPYNIDKGLVYSGWRHPSIFETMPKGSTIHCVEGFLTTKNRFLTRNKAFELVKVTGQLKNDLIGSILTSEDLW